MSCLLFKYIFETKGENYANQEDKNHCTMGPATDDDEVLKDLMRSGMDIARLNFSHGDHEEQLGRIKRIKKFREELNLPIAIYLIQKDQRSVQDY